MIQVNTEIFNYDELSDEVRKGVALWAAEYFVDQINTDVEEALEDAKDEKLLAAGIDPDEIRFDYEVTLSQGDHVTLKDLTDDDRNFYLDEGEEELHDAEVEKRAVHLRRIEAELYKLGYDLFLKIDPTSYIEDYHFFYDDGEYAAN